MRTKAFVSGLAVSGLAVLILSACTSGNNASSTPAPTPSTGTGGANTNQQPGTGTNPATGGGQASVVGGAAAGSMDGTWITDCAQTGATSAANQLTISGTSLTLASVAYADAACTQLSTTVSLSSTFVLSGPSSVVRGAQNLDVTPTTASVTIHDATTLAGANSKKLYGYDSWQADQAQDITGRTASGQTGGGPSKPFFTIVQDGGNKLYLGQKQNSTDDNTVASGRDPVLNTSLIYFKQ